MQTRAYKNLNTGSWSLKQRVGGKWVVVGHCDSLVMNDVTCHVSDARHEHVRSGNYREVFAWLTGSLVSTEGFVSYKGRSSVESGESASRTREDCAERVTFHPFADEKRGFHWADSGEDFQAAETAYFTTDAKVYAR